MQITHEQARQLIHLASDQILSAQQNGILDSHLASCAECRDYAASIQKMELILQPLLRKQWAQQPVPLSIDMLLSRPNNKSPNSMLLATRIAAIGIMLAVFMFSAWQLSLPRSNPAGPMLPSIPPVPTLSTSTILASATTRNRTCEEISYVVQGNDTLSSIADKFSISKQQIITANQLKSEIVIKGMKMVIPVCNFTPTGIVNTSTTTFIPILHTITSTPGG